MNEAQETPNANSAGQFNEKLRRVRFRMSRERPRLREEVRVIPTAIWVILGALFVIAQVVAQIVSRIGGNAPIPELRDPWNSLALAGIVAVVSVPIILLVCLVVYVNRDAKRRGMNSVLWTLLVLVLLPAYLIIGFVLYFMLREPLPYDCPQCHTSVSARFNYCPVCQFNLRPACPQCRREVGSGDRYCTHCAYDLGQAPA